MKNILLLILNISFISLSFSQNDRNYFDEKLVKYMFTNETIPASFPYELSYNANDELNNQIFTWFRSNKNLLKKSVNELLNKKNNFKEINFNELRNISFYREYIIPKESLRLYFIDETIPNTFPKYNNKKSLHNNKLDVYDWCLENKTLIKGKHLQNLEKIIN